MISINQMEIQLKMFEVLQNVNWVKKIILKKYLLTKVISPGS